MVRIGIIGDFDPQRTYHLATNGSLVHAAGALQLAVTQEWIPTPALEDDRAPDSLKSFDGLWCSPGSPYRSMAGALNAIRFARETDRPFFAT